MSTPTKDAIKSVSESLEALIDSTPQGGQWVALRWALVRAKVLIERAVSIAPRK